MLPADMLAYISIKLSAISDKRTLISPLGFFFFFWSVTVLSGIDNKSFYPSICLSPILEFIFDH